MYDTISIVNRHNVAVVNDACTAQIVDMCCENAAQRVSEKKKNETLKKILRVVFPKFMFENIQYFCMSLIMIMAAIAAIILVIMDMGSIFRFGYVKELYDIFVPSILAMASAMCLYIGRSL
jgi:hypothetical protein